MVKPVPSNLGEIFCGLYDKFICTTNLLLIRYLIYYCTCALEFGRDLLRLVRHIHLRHTHLLELHLRHICHTSAYVRIRQDTSGYVSICHLRHTHLLQLHLRHMCHKSAYVSIRHTSVASPALSRGSHCFYPHHQARNGIRQHTSAYVSFTCTFSRFSLFLSTSSGA